MKVSALFGYNDGKKFTLEESGPRTKNLLPQQESTAGNYNLVDYTALQSCKVSFQSGKESGKT